MKRLYVLSLVIVFSLTAAGCTSGSSSNSGKTAITVGTTDIVASLDPAAGYSSGDMALMNSIYQTLLWNPPNGSQPEPLVAKECGFVDPTHYKCTINNGIKFSNGESLTAEDVKYSFDRMININDPTGAAYLFEPLKSTDLVGQDAVVFTLKRPLATWPKIIANAYAGIVPKDVYPANELLASDKVIGSGPYKLSKLTLGQIAVLTPNPYYSGEKPKNAGITVVYYQTPTAMRIAFQNKALDVVIAWRSLSPTDLASLAGESDVTIVDRLGLDTRDLSFHVNLEPGKSKAVRQAAAYLIDREALVKNVLQGTAQPLYSIIPQGEPGATKPFADIYGTSPNEAKAKELLVGAGISTPVPMTLWYTPSHFGSTAADEVTEIQRQLDGSGLFNIQLKSVEFQQFLQGSIHSYPVYQSGWYPDFADADNHFSLLTGGWPTDYANPKVTSLMQKEEASTDQKARERIFAEIQKIAAEDAPVIPLYQVNYTLAIHKNIVGVPDSISNLFLLNFDQWSKQ